MGLFSSMAMDFRKIPLIAGISLLAAVLVGCGEQKETALKAGAPTKSLTSQDLMIIGDKVLKDTYQKFDVKRRCWVTENADNVSFCMKQSSINVVNDGSGQTIYLLATGGVLRRLDNAPGIAGMFVVKPDGSGYRILAQSTYTQTGLSGSVPNGKFLQLGASIGGWVFTAPEIAGNPDRTWHLYGLGNETVQDFGMLTFHYRKGMFVLPKRYEVNIDTDSEDAKAAYYPLLVTIGGSKAGKIQVQKKYVFTYDTSVGQYVPPKDWPVERKLAEPSSSGNQSTAVQPQSSDEGTPAEVKQGEQQTEAPVEVKKAVEPKPVKKMVEKKLIEVSKPTKRPEEPKKVPEPTKKAEAEGGK